MPTYLSLLIFVLKPARLQFMSIGSFLSLLLVVFIITAFIPSILSFLLVKTGYIASIEMENRKDRFLPFLTVIGGMAFLTYKLNALGFPREYIRMLFGALSSVVITTIINYFWKLSAHAVGVGGAIGLYVMLKYQCTQDANWILPLLILIAGLVCTSRLYLKAHHSPQVYAGLIVGFGSVVTWLL
jgi:membrane-associated phospholipid phosphatase